MRCNIFAFVRKLKGALWWVCLGSAGDVLRWLVSVCCKGCVIASVADELTL